MKKVLLGILITLVVLFGGCIALVGGAANSINDSINEMENETANKDAQYQEMASKIEWVIEKDDFSANIVGVFENTSDEIIDYIQFDYKTIDADGVTVESSFTNETNITPGEKRKVKIMLIYKDFEKYEIQVKSSAL